MPRYEVKLGRVVSAYEYAYVELEADDEYHARALALEHALSASLDVGDLEWTVGDYYTTDGGEIEAEDCREVKDERP